MYSLSKRLISILESEAIEYCHWKSNINLDKALGGYDDLDLLVHPDHKNKFEELLNKLQFIEASDSFINYPDVKHFYGFDTNSGNILHLHVYYSIVTGASWTKNLQLEIIDVIFNNLSYHQSGMPVPERHIEYVIYLARLVMKYSSGLENLFLMKNNKECLQELEYLLEEINEGNLAEFKSIIFGAGSEKDIGTFLKALQSNKKFKLWIYGRKLGRSIKRFRRFSVFANTIYSLSQLFYRTFKKLFKPNKKKRVHSRGTFIAITGLDATGKTTVTADLCKWLKTNFTVNLIHVGKPPSTLLTLPFNLLIIFLRKKNSDENLRSSLQSNTKPRSLFYSLRQLILAYDRYNLVKKYSNISKKGELLICDRYPSQNLGVMDSRRLNPEVSKGLKRYIAKRENYYYEKLPIPNLLFHLTVSLEVAIKRNDERIKKGKETEAFIKQRYSENKSLNYLANKFIEIDTNQDYKEELADMKVAIWQTLCADGKE